MKKRTGMSLPEVLVSMGLLGLLLAVATMLFFPQLKLGNITRNISETQEDALKAQFDLTQALMQTNAQMVLNETSQTNYSAAGLPGPAVAFPISFNGASYFDAVSPNAPAPKFTDPLTGNLIPEVVPAWNVFLVYFVDANHNLWKVVWPASGCNGLMQSGPNLLRSCNDLVYPNPPQDPYTKLYYPRLGATAISYYATSTPPRGASASLLAQNVLALEVFSGDSTPTTSQPSFNPFEVVLLVKRTYAGNLSGSPNLPRGISPNAGAIQGGDTIMTLDTSVNTTVGVGY
jgi:prepilin-type N-terminal cleavage/methylation domain-containing protein